MGTIGEQIKQYREAIDMSLANLATATKISTNTLKSIENNDFDKFKGDELYVKMYLKRIAIELKVDENLFVQQYIDLLNLQSEMLTPEIESKKRKPSTPKSNTPKKYKNKPVSKLSSKVYGDSFIKRYFKYFVILSIVSVIIFLVWSGIKITASSDQRQEYVAPSIGSVEQNTELEEQLEQERLEQERLEQELADKEAADLANPIVIKMTSDGNYSATEMNKDENTVIKVIFNSSSRFNLWSSGQISGAYGVYEDGSEYVYSTKFKEGQSFTINLWDLTDVQIYINDKEVVYDSENIPVSSGAYRIRITTIGAVDNEPTE